METARRVCQRLRAVLEWAVAMEYGLDNPCDRIGPVLGPQQEVTEHRKAVPHREASAVIGRVRASAAPPGVKLALEFLVLTAARWGEVWWAEWEEIDRHGRVWTVSARRAKTSRRHRVPCCGRALEILKAAETLEGESVHWCSPMGAVSLSMTACCAVCCASLGLRLCRTASA